MSHVAEFQFCIPRERLLALKLAVERFCPTLEFVEGETHYRTWLTDYNSLIGDWELPQWCSPKEVGKNAQHIIRMKESALDTPRYSIGAPYEIGIVPVRVARDDNGKEIFCVYDPEGNEYKLICDFFRQGNGILEQPGVGKAITTYVEGKPPVVDAFDQLKMFYQIILDELIAEENGDQIGELCCAEDGSYFRIIYTEARVGI